MSQAQAGRARAATVLALSLLPACISPDPEKRNRALADVAPLASPGAIEVLAELPRPPGNLAVLPDGRIVFTWHPESKPEEHVALLTGKTTWEPFPDAAWQHERDDGPFWVAPLALRVDGKGRLWILDHGDYGSETASLTAFDPETRAVLSRYEFPGDVAEWGSLLNDFFVDAAREVAYVADTSPFEFDPALVVVDLARKTARRVLVDHPSVSAEDQHLVVQGTFIKVLGMPLKLDVDTIALSADGEWLYYGPLSGARVWRVPTAALRDASLSEEELAARVEEWGPKPISDGGVMDAQGRLWLTAVEHEAIAVLEPDRRLNVLARDEELLPWPDGLALAPEDDGYVYAAVSELHRCLGADLDELPRYAPFRLVRVPRVPAPEPGPVPGQR